MLEHGIELRPANRKEIERDPENQAGIVEPECGKAEPIVELCLVGGGVA